MTYRFYLGNDFTISVKNRYEKLEEEIMVPQTIKLGRPSEYLVKKKTRLYKIFDSLEYEHILIADDLFYANDFAGYLNAFVSNKLTIKREYSFADTDRCIFEVVKYKSSKKITEICLKITIKGREPIYLDKITALNLANNLTKVISKCEPDYADYVEIDENYWSS